MIIIDQGSSVDLNQERDDEESDEGQYQDQEESTEDTGKKAMIMMTKKLTLPLKKK
jgi:hypothetical protein